jgi:hypothetical protein
MPLIQAPTSAKRVRTTALAPATASRALAAACEAQQAAATAGRSLSVLGSTGGCASSGGTDHHHHQHAACCGSPAGFARLHGAAAAGYGEGCDSDLQAAEVMLALRAAVLP